MSAFEVDFLESYDDSAILAELTRIAAVTGRATVTKADLREHGRVSYELVNRRFGSLRSALERAGLRPHRYMNATDTELLRMLVDLWQQTVENEGRRPQRKDLKAYGFPVSGDTYLRRFGSWKASLMRAYESVQSDDAPPPAQEPSPAAHREPAGTSRALPLRTRFFVMKRDQFACVLCGASGHGVRLEVDHRIPRARDGADDIDNLQTLCFECNRGKRDSLE